MPFTGTCNNEQKIVGLAVNYLTASGNPAVVDGPTRFSVQSGDGSVVQNGDHGFDAISGSALADTVILIEADADLGAGVRLIQDTYTLSVTGVEAASLGVSGGTVVPK